MNLITIGYNRASIRVIRFKVYYKLPFVKTGSFLAFL